MTGPSLPTLPPPAAPFPRHREALLGLEHGIHLLSHSMGPPPRQVEASMADYLRRWQGHLEADAWDDRWWDLSGEAGDLIAGLLGTRPGTVQVQPSVSVAMGVVASCLDVAGRKVILAAPDFPSTGYIWRQQARLGAEVVEIPAAAGPDKGARQLAVNETAILDAIDEHTAIVVVSHTSFLTSQRIDPRPLVEAAHRHGALVLLDAYQSCGVVEMDAAGWGVDFVVGGTIKWLCGGPGCAYLYVRPDLAASLRPRLTGWIAHEDPLAFATGPIQLAATAYRFAQGTPGIPGLCSALPGLQLISSIGVPAIAAESRRRTEWMVSLAQHQGWNLVSPAAATRRGGTVVIAVDHPAAMVQRLAAKGVRVDCRPAAGLRLSPHFFNTDEELQQAMEILARLLD